MAGPEAVPIACIVLMKPIPRPIHSVGTESRTKARRFAIMASAPAPWRNRPAIRTGSVGATKARAAPRMNRHRPETSTARFAKTSPARPSGTISDQSGVSTSGLRYYEQKKLIGAVACHGLRSQYKPSVLQELALINSAKSAGFSLDEIGAVLRRPEAMIIPPGNFSGPVPVVNLQVPLDRSPVTDG